MRRVHHAARSAGRYGLLVPALLLLLLLLASCGVPPALLLERPADAPAVYRVSAASQASFSGPVSGLEGATTLTAAFEAVPISGSAVEVEVLYLAASVDNADGEPVALDLGPLVGKKARVEFRPEGQVYRVEGDEELLAARIPLMNVPGLVEGLFPPLPDETTQVDDTWTGNVPVPFPRLGGPPVKTRYVLAGANPDSGTATVEGYELSIGPRPFQEARSGASGEGSLDLLFEGDYEAKKGYTRTQRTAGFDSSFLRLGDSNTYANGNVHLDQTVTTELLIPAEQFGLDASPRK